MMKIGDYTLKNKLGEGAFGKAYKATENETGNTCCVKVFKKNGEDA